MKLLRIICTILLLTMAFTGVARPSNNEGKRSNLIKVIDEELKEIIRMTKQTGGKNPTLLLRLAELYFEKARLIKESENQKYLSLSSKQRRNSKKASFFNKSRKNFQKAQKAAKFILKKYSLLYYLFSFLT